MKYKVFIQVDWCREALEVVINADSEEEADRQGIDILQDRVSIWSEEFEEYGDCEEDDNEEEES